MTQKVYEFYPEPRKNLPAHPDSWQKEPLPALRTTIPLERVFTAKDMPKLQHGYVPEEMEDKWFIYWDEDTLYFHRSWTGYCLFIVRFVPDGDGYKMVEAEANRDPQQYTQTDDQEDAALISYLIDVLLLQKAAEFPSDEASPERKALKNWSMVGRAMFDPPADEEEKKN